MFLYEIAFMFEYLNMPKSGNIFRVGIFLDSVWVATRTTHPHGAYVRGARRNRIDPHGSRIEVELNGSGRVHQEAWHLVLVPGTQHITGRVASHVLGR